jgi:hypothetical protein
MADLPGLNYFFALAALSMAFVGFTSVVVVLYQSTGKELSALHILLTRLFVELGLMATGFAMLAPTLSICGFAPNSVWHFSSVIMLLALGSWLFYYPFRRKRAAPDESLPLRWWVMTGIGVAVLTYLATNAFALSVAPGPAPLALASVYVLSYATVAYLGTYSRFSGG